jgi:ABC-2 type transport system ATP-binding protein
MRADQSGYAVRAAGLSKSFGRVTAVDGIDLEVRPGEIFGIVGPDGAGKTTLIRMLVGILDPTGGAAEVAGFDVVRRPEEVKRRIGYMSQRFSLYGDLTVAENLRFFANLFHVPRAERLRKEKELLQASRMEPFRDRLADRLSGGMKQKLALACTLIHTPEVLFLDEPTTGVDPVSRRDFWKILYDLLKEKVTIVVSTPYMDEAERCHRVALMDKGKVLTVDTPEHMKTGMQGELLEITATPQRPAREVLAARQEVRGIQIFGDRLHVWVSDAARDEKSLLDHLRAAGISVSSSRRLTPGLEDVFVSLLSGQASPSPAPPLKGGEHELETPPPPGGRVGGGEP